MGRYNLRATRVLATAELALAAKRIKQQPPWFQVISDYPPPPRLARPVRCNKAKGFYKPSRIVYPEDNLRTVFFSDHPWELARPKVVLEQTGNDHKGYDWGQLEQPGKRIDGESVIRRQHYLMKTQGISRYQAYDIARREFYAHRHREDVERHMAREEALSTGAYFNIGPNKIGAQLEDAAFEKWKLWAREKNELSKQRRAAGYSGVDEDAAEASTIAEVVDAVEDIEEEGKEVDDVPKTGREAIADAVKEENRPYRIR